MAIAAGKVNASIIANITHSNYLEESSTRAREWPYPQ